MLAWSVNKTMSFSPFSIPTMKEKKTKQQQINQQTNEPKKPTKPEPETSQKNIDTKIKIKKTPPLY